MPRSEDIVQFLYKATFAATGLDIVISALCYLCMRAQFYKGIIGENNMICVSNSMVKKWEPQPDRVGSHLAP